MYLPHNQLFSYSFNQLISYSVILLLNLFGVYISYLLVLKQLHIQSQYADKICSLFSKSDCNNVLESDAAKLWGFFGWSEIGLGYFSANILLLTFYHSPSTIHHSPLSPHQPLHPPIHTLEPLVSESESAAMVSALPDCAGFVVEHFYS